MPASFRMPVATPRRQKQRKSEGERRKLLVPLLFSHR
jgi:hypothetical protein